MPEVAFNFKQKNMQTDMEMLKAQLDIMLVLYHSPPARTARWGFYSNKGATPSSSSSSSRLFFFRLVCLLVLLLLLSLLVCSFSSSSWLPDRMSEHMAARKNARIECQIEWQKIYCMPYILPDVRNYVRILFQSGDHSKKVTVDQHVFLFWIIYGGFHKWGYPQIIHFNGIFHV